MKSTNIPMLNIQLIDGTINDINKNKNTKKSGFLSLINQDSSIDYNGSFKAMHGRGNSSWGQEKKPYTLEFEHDINLLNMGAAKKWLLIANAMDESSIRNKIVYDTAINMGLNFSVESRFVDLFIDGNYLGLYLLCEKIEIGQNRINITNTEVLKQNANQYSLNTYDNITINEKGIIKKYYDIPNITHDSSGGYIIEFELSGRITENNNLFVTLHDQAISIQQPGYITKKRN